MKHLFRKDAAGHLRPSTPEAQEWARKLKLGADVWVEVRKARNAAHHRKFFALLGLLFDNLPEELEERYPTMERLRLEIILQTGRFDIHETLGGRQMLIPHSMSFAGMDQDEFEQLYTDAIRVARKRFLPSLSEADLRAAVEERVLEFAA